MNNIKFDDYIVGRYIYIGSFNEGLALVRNRDRLYGFINKKGEEVIPCQYNDAFDFSEGLAIVSNLEGLKGYIDKKGKEVIPCQYNDAFDFSEGLAAVEFSKGNWIYIDKTGRQAIKGTYPYASSFSEGYAIIRRWGDRLYNYIAKDGKIFKVDALTATLFENESAVIEKDSNVCILDKDFKIVSSMGISNVNEVKKCKNGFVLIGYNDGKYKYYYEDLQTNIPGIFLKAFTFSEELAIVEPFPKWIGILNTEGSLRVFSKEQYLEIQKFSEGLAAVKNSQGLWGYINKSGKEVIPCQYKDVDPFSEGLTGVIDTEGNFYYINKNGVKKIVFNDIYYSSLELGNKTISIKADNQNELATKKLQVLSIVKEELAQTINEIEDLVYTETSCLYNKVKSNKKERNN